MHNEFSVALNDTNNQILTNHLIRDDRNEDLCFALWSPSVGQQRFTALIRQVILPEEGDRQIHGNCSFNLPYFERVCRFALDSGLGIALLHSHPVPGWQGMSEDDIAAETRIAGSSLCLTELPLLGMTVGIDGVWSARFWERDQSGRFRRRQCQEVRVIGERLKVDFDDAQIPRPSYSEMFQRTVSVWGHENHAKLARIRVGIVGLGSVGGLVAETLARSGFTRVTLIDFDEVQLVNLDRLVIATKTDVGKLKVKVAEERMQSVSTANVLEILPIPFSVVEDPGYKAALDCDVLFSCVDRPRARQILNHFAYGHLIPVIDGGIAVRFRKGKFSGVDWQLQTVGPGRPCLECLGSFNVNDVSTEIAGKLDDSTYLNGLPDDHRLKRNENIFAFSENLASLEFFQLVALVTGIGGNKDFGVQRFRYTPGILDTLELNSCSPNCLVPQLIATGDSMFSLMDGDLAADSARIRQRSHENGIVSLQQGG